MSTMSKRRRTSPTTYVSVSDQENHAENQSRPMTPKRASYQSPTKASLARSNPRVLQQMSRARQRRESEPNRRQSLRDAVLGNESLLPEAGTAPTLPTTETTTINQRGSEPTDLADNIANTFKDVGLSAPSVADAEPPTSKPPGRYMPSPRRRYIPPTPTTAIVPRLVPSPSTSSDQRRSHRSPSSELPPTPVQLGTDPAPERPRGLATSSPGGSGRRRVRIRGTNATSSPLKPKDLPPPSVEPGEEMDHAELASGIIDGPDEDLSPPVITEEEELQVDDLSDVEFTNDPDALNHEDLDQETDDPVIQEKQAQLTILQEQLRALQSEFKKIEAFSELLSTNDTSSASISSTNQALQALLDSQSLKTISSLPPPEESALFKANYATYLALFAPSNLRLNHDATSSKKTRGVEKHVYQTTITVSEPWPSTTLAITLETTLDAQTNQVDEIVFMRNAHNPAPLQSWIDERLQDPVTSCNSATITIGVRRYFEENVRRAKTFKLLTGILSSPPGGEPDTSVLDRPVQSLDDVASLLPYLDTSSQMFLPAGSQDHERTRTRHSLGSTRQVMLTYDIRLNCIGQPDIDVDVSVSGFSDGVADDARRLFREIRGVDGILSACEAVWDVLGMAPKTAAGQELGKSRKGKARRMTEFA